MRRLAALLFALTLTLFAGAAGRDRFDLWVASTDMPALVLQSGVQVLDRDGKLLRAYTVADGRWRLHVEYADVDPAYVVALIAYEDKRFWEHSGVDPKSLARAFWQALRNGRIVSGGSTLTMQVARLLEESGTGALGGKLRQIRLALALENRLSKQEILQLYLNLAPFGGNVEGLRAASLAYLGKEPRRLTLAEAALLVAIPQSPERRRPDRHPQAAQDARDRVIARQFRDGLIDADQASAARTERVPTERRGFPALAPHLADRARAEAPEQAIHRLTIDLALQTTLEALARETLKGQGERMQIAMVVADHQTGEILASIGSAAFEADRRQGFVDMTQALRSPGSTLKPLVYGLAFDQGLAHPETLIEDRPVNFNGYQPQNFDKTYRGTVRIREALQMSLNIPVVQLTDALGPARLLLALDQSGVGYAIPGNGRPGLAVALGGLGVTLQDMVQLYATLARGGVALPLRWRMDGAEAGGAAEGHRVLSASAAWQVGDILAGLLPPPGSPENRLAYKTGTSYGHRDAWAIGFDGRHVVGIWMGRPDGTPVPGAFGAELAAPVLFQAFARIAPVLVPQPPPPKETLLAANAELPLPLQHFRPRGAAFDEATGGPKFDFPPAGAEVELFEGALLIRLSGGTAPFTVMADGAPLLIGLRARETLLTGLGKGFARLSVIDAQGRSAQVSLRLR
jgi:penicillin-binding protein 1C